MSEEIENTHSLDYYLSDPFNHSIYEALERLGASGAVKFFGLFYSLLDMVEAGKPLQAIEEIDALNLSGGWRLFLTYYLREKMRGNEFDVTGNLPANTPPASLYLIDREYERLEKLFPPDPFFTTSESLDERAQGEVGLHEFSKKAVNNMTEKIFAKAEERRNIELRARQEERERLEQPFMREIREMISNPETAKKNSEFTTNRQVLALYYMLKHLQVNSPGRF